MDCSFRESVLNDWFVEGVGRGARYMIVVFDLPENEERPFYVFPEQDIQLEVAKKIEDETVDIKIVMDLVQDKEEQIRYALMPNYVVKSRVMN
jgi:hypothetical protein